MRGPEVPRLEEAAASRSHGTLGAHAVCLRGASLAAPGLSSPFLEPSGVPPLTSAVCRVDRGKPVFSSALQGFLQAPASPEALRPPRTPDSSSAMKPCIRVTPGTHTSQLSSPHHHPARSCSGPTPCCSRLCRLATAARN
ncbi:hypothetical protein P7K49_032790 [Saguinus oedipus]|uniref:Uncharacterized protein n=1 Tax=Saguinus oedipus TaxID=9490 RepID=A0ABQ9TQ32_SAGOE|nr:hypothetical protein P7K49_032790 [Saguinus oedipus]